MEFRTSGRTETGNDRAGFDHCGHREKCHPVPKAAVFQLREGGTYVIVAGSDNIAHQKIVQLGFVGATETQIKSGITAGESVIRFRRLRIAR